LQVQFEEMSGWSADSDAAAMLSNLGIGEEHHFTLMADLEAKLRFVFFCTSSFEIQIDYG
jgi:hypothetical protein